MKVYFTHGQACNLVRHISTLDFFLCADLFTISNFFFVKMKVSHSKLINSKSFIPLHSIIALSGTLAFWFFLSFFKLSSPIGIMTIYGEKLPIFNGLLLPFQSCVFLENCYYSVESSLLFLETFSSLLNYLSHSFHVLSGGLKSKSCLRMSD